MPKTPHLTPLLLAIASLGLVALGCGPDDQATSATGGESDTGVETDTGDTGEDPEPIAVERGLLASVYSDGVLRYVVHEISQPDASPLVWSFEPGQEVSLFASRFGTYYATIGAQPTTQELHLTDEGFVDMRPLLPPEVPQELGVGPFHGPNDDVALAILGDTDLYELRFDADGQVSSARELFAPPPPDAGGQFHVGRIHVSATHAVFALIYSPVMGDGDRPEPYEAISVWGLPLDGTSEPELLVELAQPYVEMNAPYVLDLVGDQLVYGDDPDLDGDLDLYTKPVEDPGGLVREICPGPDGSLLATQPSSVAGELLCTRQLGLTSDLLHVDLDDPDAPTELIGELALGLAHTHALDEDRLLFLTRPYDYFGPMDKGWSLMLAERVDGVWQSAVQVSEQLTNMDAGIYGVTYGLGGVVYAGADGDATWLSWIDLSDLSGPDIPPPVTLVEDIGPVGSIALPSTGTRFVFSSRPDSFQLTSLDLSDPAGSRIELRPLFPEGWLYSGAVMGLVNDGSEVVFRVDGPKFLARMPIDGSRAPIQTCVESEVYAYDGELLPPSP